MLNCWACPLYLDCEVQTEVKRTRLPVDKVPGTEYPDRDITTPKNEADCPLKQAVDKLKSK